MNSKILQIKKYSGPGYKPVIDFEKWRVAIINHPVKINPDKITKIERHMKTDEVFVLLKGDCVLITGGIDKIPWKKLEITKMLSGYIYNFRKAAWHGLLMKKSSKLLIVENRNTANRNSEYFNLTKTQIRQLVKYKKYI